MSPTKMLGTDGTNTRSVDGATVVGQDFVGNPIALGQVPTSLLHVLAVKSHPTPEYAWEGVELALLSTNAIEHLSPTTRPAIGCSVCRSWPPSAKPLEWDTSWPATRWWSTPTARAPGCSGRRHPTPTTSARTSSALGVRAGRHLGAEPAGRRLLRPDDLRTPVGWLSSSRVLVAPPDPHAAPVTDLRLVTSRS
jgi:hypothetical protein